MPNTEKKKRIWNTIWHRNVLFLTSTPTILVVICIFFTMQVVTTTSFYKALVYTMNLKDGNNAKTYIYFLSNNLLYQFSHEKI